MIDIVIFKIIAYPFVQLQKKVKKESNYLFASVHRRLGGAHRWGDQTNMPELPKLPIPTTCWDIKEKFNILRKVSNHSPSDSLKFEMKSFPIFAGSGQVANSIGDQLNSSESPNYPSKMSLYCQQG